MLNYNNKNSKVTRSLWLGMAVFFVVFCSCPVKRYIRQHLYQHKPLVERTAGEHFSTNDIKDCSIAERHEQSQTIILSFLHRPANNHNAGISCLPLFLSFASVYFFRRNELANTIPSPDGIPVPVPLYLRIRHLQV